METGTYIGQAEDLKGERALLLPVPGTHEVKAQFDNFDLGPRFTHNWTLFPKADWDIDEEED